MSEVLQAGVQQGDVFALQQPDPAKLVRQGDAGARHFLIQDPRRLLLTLGGQRGEDAGDANRGQAGIGHAPGGIADGAKVQRHDWPAIIFMPAGDHVHLAAYQGG